MKIIDHEIILINNIEPYRGGRYWLFLQLITDEGIVGLGERPSGNAMKLEAQISLLRDLCEQFVIGVNPFDIEALWQRIFASRHDYRHPGLDATPALSAIEMACWDIVGKALNQPIYNLLGGKAHAFQTAQAAARLAGVRWRGWDHRPRRADRAGGSAGRRDDANPSAHQGDPRCTRCRAFAKPRCVPVAGQSACLSSTPGGGT